MGDIRSTYTGRIMSHLPSWGVGCGLSPILAGASPTPTMIAHHGLELSRKFRVDTAMIHQRLAQDMMRHRSSTTRSTIEAEVRHTLSGVWAGLTDEQVLINWRKMHILSSSNLLAKVVPIIQSHGESRVGADDPLCLNASVKRANRRFHPH